jgi:hypothetical protein
MGVQGSVQQRSHRHAADGARQPGRADPAVRAPSSTAPATRAPQPGYELSVASVWGLQGSILQPSHEHAADGAGHPGRADRAVRAPARTLRACTRAWLWELRRRQIQGTMDDDGRVQERRAVVVVLERKVCARAVLELRSKGAFPSCPTRAAAMVSTPTALTGFCMRRADMSSATRGCAARWCP